MSRSQGNFNFLTDGDFPFANLAYGAAWWVYGSSSELVLDPSQVNAYGLPTVVPGPGLLYLPISIPSQAQRPGNLVLTWTGTATFAAQFSSFTLVSGSLSGTNGRAVITPTDSPTVGGIYIALTAVTSLTSIDLRHVDDEGRVSRFHPRFIEKLLEGNCATWRFLNWQLGNTSMVSAWGHRKPEGYFSYRADEYRSSLYKTTTNTGDAYSASGVTFADKQTYIVKFNADASGTTPTLAGKTIKNQSGGTLSSAQRPKAGKVGLLVADTDLDCWLKDGGDDAQGNKALSNAVPPEVMIDLCNEIGADLWIVTPFLCSDNPADYMGGFLELARTRLNPGRKVNAEGPNEGWNEAAGFYFNPYALNKSLALWGSSSMPEYYGRALSLLGQAAQSVFSGDRNRYRVTCGVWTFDPVGDTTLAARLASANYVADGGTAASLYTTHLCIANYWNTTYTAQEELDAAHEYEAGDTAERAAISSDYASADQHVFVANDVFNQYRVLEVAAIWKARADSYGLGLIFYEGGWSPDYPLIISSYIDYTPGVTAATKASQAVITLAAGFPLPPVGSSVSFASMGGMTELNGNTYDVVARNTGAQQITINVNSTGFGTFTSGGTCNYVDSGQFRTNLREASKAAPELEWLTARFYADLVALGADEPSMYMFSGDNAAWSVFDPDIFATPSPQWNAIAAFNDATVLHEFSETIPLSEIGATMRAHAIDGPTTFSVGFARDGGTCAVKVFADGTNTPSFSGMTKVGTGSWVNTAGAANILQFFRLGETNYYSVTQPS